MERIRTESLRLSLSFNLRFGALKNFMKPIFEKFVGMPPVLVAFGVLFSSLESSLVAQETEAETGSQEVNAITAKTLETLSAKIYEAKKAFSLESTQWEEQRALFTDLVTIREKEIAEIDEFTAAAKERVEVVKKQRDAFDQEEAERKTWRADFQKRVESLEAKLRPALVRLPQPVMDKVEQSAARLKAADEEAPLQERFRDVLAILSAVQDFSNRITVVTEIREFDGKEVELDVMYLGLAQAWFTNRNGQVAGIGWPSDEGWKWEQDRSFGSKIRTAINVQRREAPAEIVRLPFREVTR